MGNPFLPPFSTVSRAARRLEKRKRPRKRRRHSKERNQEEEEVDMMIRELQKCIPNSTTIDVDCVLDEAIEYVKSLQSELHALLEAMRYWETALAAYTAGLQCPQCPMGPTFSLGASFLYSRPY